VYGADKVWHQLGREKGELARCTVERLMRRMGLRSATRDRAFKITTAADENAVHPPDLVNRELTASRPNQLWVAGITSRLGPASSTSRSSSTCSRASSSAGACSLKSDLALDALEKSLHARSDVDGTLSTAIAGRKYTSIRYTECLADACLVRSVSSVGDSYDIALAETINGLYKTEEIRRSGPWVSVRWIASL